MGDILLKAKDFCIKKHNGQKRKYSDLEYSTHPIMVAEILKFISEYDKKSISKELIVAGYLHDVLEDTNTTEKEIKENFGDKVLEIVKEVTGPGNIKTKDGILLKLVDMLSNLHNISETNNELSGYLQDRILEMNNMQKRLKSEPSVEELVNFYD